MMAMAISGTSSTTTSSSSPPHLHHHRHNQTHHGTPASLCCATAKPNMHSESQVSRGPLWTTTDLVVVKIIKMSTRWWLSVNSEDDDDDDDNGKEGASNTQCQCWRQRPWQGRAAAAGPPSQTCPKPLKKEMFIFWCSFQSLSWLQPHTSEKGSRPVLASQPFHPTIFDCLSLDSLFVSITLMVSVIFK